MIILTRNSLGERQRDLNEKVNKAAAKAFNQYKAEGGKDDVDIIFLIDVAARFKNVEFILEILKSGDGMHITRALNKCTWLSHDDFAHIFNVDNLHKNLLPLMSIKMKKKLLSVFAIHLKTESRAIHFYEYCMRERLYKIAMKFLLNTPESFKNDVISQQKSQAFQMVLSNKEEALANFIGDSFTLAQTFLGKMETYQNRNDVLYLLRYLYSISSSQYLDLLEKYKNLEYWYLNPTRFGNRISKDIIKKHKNRVLKNPKLYVHLLNECKIAKNSTVSDVKVYAVSLLPDEAATFWNINFYEKYKFILDVIPADERYCFIKKIFTEKYHNEQFEKSENFYSHNFYNMMTNKEKETWALRHIIAADEMLGSGNDYIWYKFVSFDKAFEEIKKYVHITSDGYTRMKMVNVLVDSAKTQDELEILLNYFYNRHVNESPGNRLVFINELLKKHNVYNFGEKCWQALEKLFCSLKAYTSQYEDWDHMGIGFIYYVTNQKTVPKVLCDLIHDKVLTTHRISCQLVDPNLKPENVDRIFQYLHKFFSEAVEFAVSKDNIQSIIRYLECYLDVLDSFSKSKDDIAENINKYIQTYEEEIKNHRFLVRNTVQQETMISDQNIRRFIKKDATLVIDEFPAIKTYIQNRFGRINWSLNKLKIYFQHDIAKKYLQLLHDSLFVEDVNYLIAQVAVFGIFKLADEPFKIEFMKKNAPTSPKIDHANISRNLLKVQEAICGYMCVSRPPVPLTYVSQYLVGDYVHHCLPIFNCYLMNLPLPACLAFVESIIDKPVSIQKHGLRLAFQCFSTENLKTLLNDIWKRTKNISMRKILYKALLDKILKESHSTQLELFEILNKLTLDLHQDDDSELFLLLSLTHNKLPNHVKGQYLVSGWKAVQKLPERSVNFERCTAVIKSFERDLNLVPDDEVMALISNHVYKMLDEKEILNKSNTLKNGLDDLYKAKWQLTIKYLTNVYNEEQLKKRLEIVKHIIQKCLEMRKDVLNGKYVVREFCMRFIRDLDKKSFDHEIDSYHEVNSYPHIKVIFTSIFKDLEEALPEHEIFALTLEIRLSAITRDVIISCKEQLSKMADKNEIIATIRTAIDKFAEALVKLVTDYIDNGKYFGTFHEKMESSITEQLDRVNRKLDAYFRLNLKSDDLSVLLCVNLLKYETTEIYLFVLKFLPLNYNGILASEYENTIVSVKAFKNDEVQYFMYEKFVNYDFNLRSQINA